ncbi:BEM_collapsed_G0049720.mRNA.1.CDS.1 [Saccharomyces cerevisiae]|nr:BEM_collapsed_G0049720.mRNA.1.CDS.1 [Saccharomyces cerevisiae]
MAIKSWQRALQLNPKNTSASILVLLGEFRESFTNSTNDKTFKEAFTKALSDLNNIFSENQHNPVLLTLLQTYYYFKGDYQTVLDIYHHRILKMSPMIAKIVLSESSFWCGRAHYALALKYLERYLKLTLATKNQLVISRAYLVISQLYELQNQYKKTSLDYLSKALEKWNSLKRKFRWKCSIIWHVTTSIYGDFIKADDLFKQAKAKVSDKDESVNITLEYNIARTNEKKRLKKSESIYSQVTSLHPAYIAARIRNLYLKFAQSKIEDSDMSTEMNKLLDLNKSDLRFVHFMLGT